MGRLIGRWVGGWVCLVGMASWWLLYRKHVPGLCISKLMQMEKCNNIINIMYSLGMAQFIFILCVVKCMCLALGYIEN
jgi:hypothetical protein